MKKKLALYPIYINEVVAPHYTLQKAFEKNFDCLTYDWLAASKRIGLRGAQMEFIELLKLQQPEYAFLQLQNSDNMSVEVVREMVKHTKIIQWSGDIRQTKAWYDWFEAIGKEIHLTLFSNMTDVKLMRDRGVRADYLQVGYDTGWYYAGNEKREGIVFSAHNYGNFQLSDYRIKVAQALKEEFKGLFTLYGGGWEKHGFKTTVTNCKQEADAYRKAKIGISVSNFDFERYHSDRLLRIMACGAMPMSHAYQGIELDYTQGKNIVSFRDIPELIASCRYYMKHEADRQLVCDGAIEKVTTECNWDYRCIELIELLEKYDS
jgi:hypothetical protein